MNSRRVILEKTPSLHKWLSRQLSQKGITQRRLAGLVRRSPSQVNHWISGREPIPPGLFLQAVSATIPEASKTAEHLFHVHEREKLLKRESAGVEADGNREAISNTAKVIGRRAEESAIQCGGEDEAMRFGLLSDNLAAGVNVLNMIKACKEEHEPFIHPGNIQLHLRFPHNLMASDLIQFYRKNPCGMEEVRFKLFSSMRQTIKNKGSGKYDDYVRQHAYHILARSGDNYDRELVFDITKASKDLQTRRTAHYAQIGNVPDPQAAERFIYELEHEPELAAVTLDFDLVHYGDKALDDQTPLRSVENVVVHNLRHIQTHQRAATAQVALHKLLDLLSRYGGWPFDRRRIYPRIRKIIEGFQLADYSQLTIVEKKFLNQFSSLQLPSSPVFERVSSPANQLKLEFS